MSIPLLANKLAIPLLPPRAIPRPHRVERLNAGLRAGHHLTVVSAPAGYGKTLLVAEWARSADRPFAWLTLESDDDDPVRFATCLVAALQQVDSTIGQDALRTLAAAPIPATQSFMPALAGDLAAATSRFALVLDDFQVIQSPDIHAGIAYLLDHLPAPLHLVLVTRADPSLPLPRLRVRGQLTELGATDLRLSEDEIARFFAQVHGMTLDPPAIAALESRTEGWIAGLQLAALATQGHTDSAACVADFSGSHHYVIDYLVTEVLRSLPDELRTFLGQTAILERLSAPLCEAVTGQPGSADLLRQVEQANLFLVPLDDQRAWYRYHQLFAEMLRSALRPPDRLQHHQRAAAWYAAHGFPHEAVKHALAAKDQDAAAPIICAAASQALDRGELATLLSWLAALPEAQICACPDLATYKGWALWLTGQVAAAAEYAHIAQLHQPADAPALSRGRLLSLRAVLAATLEADPRQLAGAALDLLEDSEPFCRSALLFTLAHTQLAENSTSAAIETLRVAAQLGEQHGQPFIAATALAKLALTLHQHGKSRQAMVVCRQAMATYTDVGGQPLPVACGVYLVAGQVACAANQLGEAQQHITTGLTLAQQIGLSMAILEGKATLARVQCALGEGAAALATLADAQAIAIRTDLHRFDGQLAICEAELQLRLGNRAAAERWAASVGESASFKPATWGEPAYLLYARVLLIQQNPQAALNLLARMAEWEQAGERYGRIIPITILQALAHQSLGQPQHALACLAQGVRLAAPEHYDRAFLDEGPPITALLPAVHDSAASFVDHLLNKFQLERLRCAGESAPPLLLDTQPISSEAAALVEPISARERDVLYLLADGLTYAQIAAHLVVSLNTVRSHVKNLYGKLGVHQRMQAIVRARGLQLLQ
jgi:LuxR family transcriptional regulator, maltose regulon positive regulatory protein